MPTLLLVEDSPTEALIITSCLERGGFTLLKVTTAEAAKAILNNKAVDGIVLDVVLPGQSGFGLCRELKQDPKTEGIPVIMCSSKSEKMDKKWASKQGANDYVTKPIDENELLNTVRKWVN
jgi:twitching motility two-component system response regulator PilH/chemotaxis family two-component system response regulator PixH